MNKIINISMNVARHNDVFILLKEIKRRKMNLSAVVRELLREFRDRDYCFYTEEQEEELF